MSTCVSARRPPSQAPAALVGLSATVLGSQGLRAPRRAGQLLERTNFHGRTVSLRGGAGVALGAVAAPAWTAALHARRPSTALPALAGAVAAACGGLAGLVDDLDAGAHDGDVPAKGLRGHLGALRQGRVTTGVLKIGVIGAGAGLAGGILAAGRRRPGRTASAVADAVTSAVVIASWANLHNLLDLRPGRALKTGLLVTTPLAVAPGGEASRVLAAGAAGAAAAALPEDLAEDTMLGDTGANALGALVGTSLAAHPATALRLAAACLGTGLVLASERISFSKVIAASPVLNALDTLGRRAQ